MYSNNEQHTQQNYVHDMINEIEVYKTVNSYHIETFGLKIDQT